MAKTYRQLQQQLKLIRKQGYELEVALNDNRQILEAEMIRIEALLREEESQGTTNKAIEDMRERESQRQIIENNKRYVKKCNMVMFAVLIAINAGIWSVNSVWGLVTASATVTALFPTTKEKARRLRKDRVNEAYAKRYGSWF